MIASAAGRPRKLRKLRKQGGQRSKIQVEGEGERGAYIVLAHKGGAGQGQRQGLCLKRRGRFPRSGCRHFRRRKQRL